MNNVALQGFKIKNYGIDRNKIIFLYTGKIQKKIQPYGTKVQTSSRQFQSLFAEVV